MKFNHRARVHQYRAHHYVVGAIAVLPLALSVTSASVVTTSADTGRPSQRPGVQTALFAAPGPVASLSSTRFDLLDEGDASDVLAARRAVERELKISSPKGTRTWTASALAEHDLPSAAARAYKNAARSMDGSDPACQLPWTLLAGIGRVESDHGRYGGSVLASNGVSHPLIIGVPLNGVGPVAAIADSDGGKLDGDKVWDRAVGPMQFIPTTWSGAGRDGDGDGVANPNDIDDATLAAAGYLCSGSGSVLGNAGMRSAVYRYNQSEEYVDLVLAFEAGYRTGTFILPSPPPVEEDVADRPKKKRKAVAAKTGSKKNPVKKKAVTRKPAATKPKPSTSPRPTSSPSPKPSSKSSGTKSGTKKGGNKPSDTKSPRPSQTPSSTPQPTPTGPVLVEMSGIVTDCGGGLCLGTVTLEFAPGVELQLTELMDSRATPQRVTLLVEETETGLKVYAIVSP